jgi:hypothetical protein
VQVGYGGGGLCLAAAIQLPGLLTVGSCDCAGAKDEESACAGALWWLLDLLALGLVGLLVQKAPQVA